MDYLRSKTDVELAAYAKHLLAIGVHPDSKAMNTVVDEMDRRQALKPLKVTVVDYGKKT